MTAELDSDVVRAQGKLVIFLASLLQRADIVAVSEFARLLDIFASTVTETDPGEGELLAYWAAVVGETVGGPHN